MPRSDTDTAFNLEAEQAVLGSIMLQPDCIWELQAAGLTAGCFCRPGHSDVFHVLSDLVDRGVGIDPLTVAEELRSADKLQGYLDRDYILSLFESEPTAAHALDHARIVLKYVSRRKHEAYTAACRALEQDVTDPEELWARTYELLDGADVPRVFNPPTAADVAGDLYAELDADNPPDLLNTGIAPLDERLQGIESQTLTVLSGWPSTGKTVLGMQIIMAAAASGKTCGILSIETSRDRLIRRQLAVDACVDANAFKAGRLTAAEREKVARVMGLPQYGRLRVDDRGDVTEENIGARIRTLKSQHGASCILIDYLQLVGSRGDDRRLGIDRIVNRLKELAKELDLRVFLISQLSRDGKLKESGGIDAAADTHVKLTREPGEAPTKAEIAKNRDGWVGTIDLWFKPFKFYATREEVTGYE